jgi:predicted alpha/beta hydrolase family esterase
MEKSQILMVHGGMTFKNEKEYLHFLKTRKVSTKKRPYWEADLEEKLQKKFEIIRPRMPLQDNAKYRDWELAFERYVPLLRKNSILIGSSLGGIFLAQYLSQHKLPQKALSVYSLPSEDLVGGFKLRADLSLLEKNCKNLHLLFSKDDDVVPASHAEKYRKKLKKAHIVVYKSKKGHFTIPRFPEILKMIAADVKGA